MGTLAVGRCRATSRGEAPVTRLPSTGRAVILLALASVVALGAVLTIAGIWLHPGGRQLLELGGWLAGGAALSLTIGVFLLWVIDRAADGKYATRLALSGVLTVLVFATSAVLPIWRHTDAATDRRFYWVMLTFATLIATIFAVFAAWLDARPLRNMAARVGNISGGHFDARMPENGNDEIRQTAIAINLLAARAQSASVRQSNQDRARESLLLAIAGDAQLPLDNIRTIVETMASHPMTDPAISQRYLDALSREATGLQHRIDEIEEFAQLENGHVTLRMQPVALAQLVIDVCERLQPAATIRNVIIGPHVDFAAPRVLVDPNQTHRALEALFAYALAETPDGGHLSVEMRESGQFVQVAAIELPGGRPLDTAERVRWESAHRRRESALSLAVAGRLIEIQGGSFLVSSSNPGTPMVVVSLPRS